MANCTNISAPVNITNNTKICQGSCNYLPEYTNKKILVRNMNSYISVSYDNADSAPQSKFNNENYKVKEVRIFNKSLHQYNGNYAPGEILLIHQNVTKPNDLLIVSISISISSLATSGTPILNALINATNDQAPRSTLSTAHSSGSVAVSPPFVPNISFNLQKFISPSPFTYYKGVFSFQSTLGGCGSQTNIIVYTPQDYSVSLTNENYNILKALLNNPPANLYPISPGGQLYINSKGASNQEEDIFIDCQPVDASTDTVYVPDKSINNELEKVQKELEKLVKGPLGGGLIGIVLLLGLWFIIDSFFGFFKNVTPGPFSQAFRRDIDAKGGPINPLDNIGFDKNAHATNIKNAFKNMYKSAR